MKKYTLAADAKEYHITEYFNKDNVSQCDIARYLTEITDNYTPFELYPFGVEVYNYNLPSFFHEEEEITHYGKKYVVVYDRIDTYYLFEVSETTETTEN